MVYNLFFCGWMESQKIKTQKLKCYVFEPKSQKIPTAENTRYTVSPKSTLRRQPIHTQISVLFHSTQCIYTGSKKINKHADTVTPCLTAPLSVDDSFSVKLLRSWVRAALTVPLTLCVLALYTSMYTYNSQNIDIYPQFRENVISCMSNLIYSS